MQLLRITYKNYKYVLIFISFLVKELIDEGGEKSNKINKSEVEPK